MDDRCEVANTEIDMTGDAKDKTEGHETVPIEIDKIAVRRLFNKEKPDQGVCEAITVGTTVTCRTCLNTEIEGEILAFNTHTKMVIIKPTLALDQPLRKGIHMVNKDYVKTISIVRVCTNKPPETTIFDVKGPHTSVKEGVEKEEVLFDKEEVPADNGVPTKYEYTHSGNVKTKPYQWKVNDEADSESVIKLGTVANTSYRVTGQTETKDQPQSNRPTAWQT
jgi:hypothetical protein